MAGIELYAPRLERHRRTWTAAAIVLAVVFIALGQLATVLGILLPMGFHSADLQTNWTAMAIQLFGFGFTALLIFLWVWLFERRSLACIGFNVDGLKRFGRGFLIGLAFLGGVVGLIALAGGYRIEAAGVWSAPTAMTLLPIGILLLGFIIQGSTEEIVMRGWVMQLIASRHGIIWAITANAIIFSLLHAGNMEPKPELLLGLVNIVLVGVFFSLYAIKERSLWGVCGWHASWNWLLGLGFGLDVSGQGIKTAPLIVDLADREGVAWWITGGAFGPEGSVIATLVLAAGVAWLIWKGAMKPTQSYATPAQAVES